MRKLIIVLHIIITCKNSDQSLKYDWTRIVQNFENKRLEMFPLVVRSGMIALEMALITNNMY